ncbi:ParA family protein [Ketobacter sp.]|uniref:ParA family protein n=1 Tax=Ketobacter sp. TaxID=2083498 RepID=UPI000F274B53|nr:ParA family protein [Ketobacter sp.]RLU00502.1 MAG: ParA family protein [Ketobacter sp.]
MKVWAVANQKGGVGKTTTVVGLGGLLAENGHRVLMIDLDPHGSLTSYFQYNPDEMSKSVYQLFQHKGDVPAHLPRELVLSTGYPRLDFLPASTSLAMLERQAVSQGGAGLVISKTIAWLWDDYDYVLMDTPPILGVLLINALAACQQLLLPVQTEFLAIKGLERMMRTLQMVMKSQKRELPYLVVPTMFDRRTQASVGSLRLLRQTYDGHIWPAAIPEDTRFRDASKAGKPPSAYDANSRGVAAYSSLLKYLMNREPQLAPKHELSS